MAKICKICGKQGYMYFQYCYEHLQQIKKEGQNSEEKKENTCKKCGKPSGEYDLCYKCYRTKVEEDLKQDRSILIQSEKDSGIDIRDKWPAEIRTIQGCKVRSHAECRIADWLYSQEVRYDYERQLYKKDDVEKFLLSDFFLPDYKIYIEYWGYKDSETYNKRREEKMQIYKFNECIVEHLQDRDLKVLDDALRAIAIKHGIKLKNP
ncbi:MAG: hypothetical protein LBR37_03860 [Erysipelotrichaceae bacterium]|jgi:hypothetical protein|nr:hypothetical protein [Erysipelotrichaceae bacterium]